MLTSAALQTPRFSTFAHFSAIILLLVVVYLLAFDLDYYLNVFVAKDGAEGTGIAEHLTWIILLPGIALALAAIAFYRDQLPNPLPIYWLFTWALACVYFAGEEASWGQWYFLWETPEEFLAINDQQETNLHNTSSWLDQKPRMLVELWIFLGGFVWPLLRMFGLRPQRTPEEWRYWIAVPQACFSAALLFTLVRFADWFNQVDPLVLHFGNSELRELTIALFLTLYLSSYWVRLRAVAASASFSK